MLNVVLCNNKQNRSSLTENFLVALCSLRNFTIISITFKNLVKTFLFSSQLCPQNFNGKCSETQESSYVISISFAATELKISVGHWTMTDKNKCLTDLKLFQSEIVSERKIKNMKYLYNVSVQA